MSLAKLVLEAFTVNIGIDSVVEVWIIRMRWRVVNHGLGTKCDSILLFLLDLFHAESLKTKLLVNF